ncbi:MAG: 23S rRNA (adenine(2503)-C(2))-methyltransferase RlmN [candidate division WOR-3 bacterium]
MSDIRSLTLEELTELVQERGWESYRARQLFRWLWQKGCESFDEMTNLSKDFRAALSRDFEIGRLETLRRLRASDGTVKFTFRLHDGKLIESVYIPEDSRRTVCVSTQVGCSLGCKFCATGRQGFYRNLGWHEIAGQVLAIRQFSKTVTNVVFMGMGEPFLNYDATAQATRVINSPDGLAIGARHITVSTAGIPDAIRAFARLGWQVRLALSLNAADDRTRSWLMPVNRRFPLAEVIVAIRDYTAKTGRRVTFEYVLIRGINDRPKDITHLATLLKGIPCKLNLIPLNPFPGCPYEPPSPAAVEKFARELYPLLPAVTIRKSKGATILAGCGQLASVGES